MSRKKSGNDAEKISDELVGCSRPCTCGTLIDEMLSSGMDDDLQVKPIKKEDIPGKEKGSPKNDAIEGNQ